MRTRILIVEDDTRIGLALSFALEELGYDVQLVPTGEQAIASVASTEVDVVLLDLMLPGMDGIEVCRQLRSGTDVPIIMLTARDDSSDVIAGLEAGADDYVSKPVSPDELSARLQAVLRRVAPGRPRLRLGDLELRRDEAVVLRDGEPVDLTRTQFRLLCELAEEPGVVRTREDLLKKVWGYEHIGDTRLLDVHISRLRTRIEIDPSEPRIILTVRGAGYRLGA